MIIKKLAKKNRRNKESAEKKQQPLQWKRFSPVTSHQSRNLRQREAWSRDNAGHAQDLLIFLFRDGRNNQANIFQKLQFPHQGIFPEFVEGNLPGQPFHGSQVSNEHFRFQVMRVRIRVPADFRDRIQGSFGRRVVTEYSVALAHLLESANRVRACTRSPPHFLALHKQRIPMIMVRIY